MAEGGKQPGRHDGQPLELNWAGCDVHGRDLLDLDEADSELVNIETFSYEVERDFFLDININREPNEGRQPGWGPVKETRWQVSRNVPKSVLSEGSRSKSPEYPPTLLELEVQALAKIGMVKLYHDSRDLEEEEARAEEERKLAIIKRFDRERQALSPLPGQRLQQVQAVERGDLPEFESVSLSMSTSVGTDVLELQKVALSRMKGAAQPKTPAVGSPSNAEGDLLELQKVALASMTKLSEVLQPHSPTPVSAPVPQSTTGGDLSELQRAALANMRNHQNETSSSPFPLTLQATPPSTPPEGCSSLKQRTVNDKSGDKGPLPAPLQPCTCLLSLRKVSHKSAPKVGPVTQAGGGGKSLELQKVPPKGLLEQPLAAPTPRVVAQELPNAASASQQAEPQKAALQSVTSQQAPPPALPRIAQEAGEGDLLEPQKLSSSGVPKQATPTLALPKAEKLADFQEQQIRSPKSVPIELTPTQGNHQTGGDSLELQKVALGTIISDNGTVKIVSGKIELKQQNNTSGSLGTSSSSSTVFSEMSAREPLGRLLQELYSKDQALQSANRIIGERSQLLREYEESLANAVNLLESMNVRCTDSKKETAKVLTETEEIFQNLSHVCHAFENFDCSVPQCGKRIHCLDVPVPADVPGPAVVDNSNFLLGTDNGVGVNPGEIDERRNFIEELLKELSSIEIVRKEAQHGFQLQIQRNEQLIAELQKLDVAPNVFDGVPYIRDGDHAEVTSEKIAGHRTNDMVSTGHSQHAFNHPIEPPAKIPSDQALNSLCDHAYEDPSDQALNNLCDHAYEDPNDQALNNLCDHAYEDPSDQALNNLCDHAYEDPRDHAKGNLCDHVYEDVSDQAEGKLCDHVYEDLSNHRDQNHPSNQMSENSRVHASESPHDQVKEATKISCDHVYEVQSEQVKETPCDHVYENPKELVDQNSCDHTYEKTGGKPNQNQYDPHENSHGPFSEILCYQSDEQTSELPSDHEFDGSCDLTSEYTSDQASEDPHDCAYEDGKGCDLVPTRENIGSASFNSPTWMPPILFDKQLPTSSNQELQVAADLRLKERAHLRKRSYCNGRVSSKDSLWEHLQHFVRMEPTELQSQVEHKAEEIMELHKQIDQLQASLLQEKEKNRNIILQKTDEANQRPTKSELEDKDKVIRKMHFQIQQLEAALRQEREEYREALAQKNNEITCAPTTVDLHLQTKEINELHQQLQELQNRLQVKENNEKNVSLSTTVDTDHLKASLHAKDEDIRELQEIIARKEVDWQTEKHRMMKHFDELETKLLVKEEENIKLTHELEISISSDGLNFTGDIDESHYFHNQMKEEGREILDLRCEVLSLQDCLGIKTQAIKTMERELARSYNIVTELRSKLRGLQEGESNSRQREQNIKLIERLRSTEEKLHICQSEKVAMSAKIQDLSARCKYLQEFEHLYKEGSNDMKAQAIKELEGELERNVEIIKNMQIFCNEYEARAKEAKEELERKDELLIKLEGDVQNLKKQQNFPGSPSKYQPLDGGSSLVALCEDGRVSNANTNGLSSNSLLEHGKVESPNVTTLRKLLTDQWRIQKAMEDRLNTMMTYVSDRVDEFEQMSNSDATSDSSFVPNPQLNYFHVEAKLMKLQLEQQLQILRGTTFTSLPSSGVTSPGQCTQTCLSTQSMQLMVEKNALEDSAQTLQEKTSRLLNKLTFMRSEFGPNSC